MLDERLTVDQSELRLVCKYLTQRHDMIGDNCT